MQEGPQGDDVLREGLDGYEQMVNTFADQAKTYWKSVGPAGVPVVLSIASWVKMQHAYTQWIRQASRAVNQPQHLSRVCLKATGRGLLAVVAGKVMRPTPEYLKALKEIQRESISGLVEVLREPCIEAIRYVLCDATGWQRDHSPPAWRKRATAEQNQVSWEIAVRIEKILCMFGTRPICNRRSRQMETRAEGTEGSYKSYIG